MKKFQKVFLLLVVGAALVSFNCPQTINVWMIGDSTMANKNPDKAPETGWGMVLQEFVKGDVLIHNHAVNGRSSKSFLSENRWKPIMDSIQTGDYVIIQFGHNDQKADSIRHTDPFTTYKSILRKYIAEARSRGAQPIVCSSVVRRNFDAQGNLVDTHGDYIQAAREIAAETNTPFIDMEAKTRKLVSKLGVDKSKEYYLFTKPGEYENRVNGVQDSTHLQARGAHAFAALFVKGLKEHKLPLAKSFSSKAQSK